MSNLSIPRLCVSLFVGLAACAPDEADLSADNDVEQASTSVRTFVPGAVIGADHAVTLPLRQGRSGGQDVWYIVTEASSSAGAEAWATGRADKLARARGTTAVQRVTLDAAGRIVFPATANFSAQGAVVSNYSPLVELPDGTILNAPHLANASGRANKVVSLDLSARRVRYRLTDGFANDSAVLYISTEASSPEAAALENVTYAPALDAAPFAGGDGTNSARAALAAITNGATGVQNPNRQGINSASLGEGDPLNILAWTPNQGRYSPLWDVHLSTWAPGQNPVRLTDIDDVSSLADAGQITAPDGSAWKPSGFVVNCPIISQR